MDAIWTDTLSHFGFPIALAVWLLWRERENTRLAAERSEKAEIEARRREADLVLRIRQLEDARNKDLIEVVEDNNKEFERLILTLKRRPCLKDAETEEFRHGGK